MVSSSFCLASVRENNWKNVCLVFLKGGGEYSYCVLVIFYVATFFLWYPNLIIRYSKVSNVGQLMS